MVDVPFLVKGPPEYARRGGGIADEQQARLSGGHHRLDCLINPVADSLRFVHYNQHIGAVKALELVGGVGGQAHSVAVIGQFPTSIQQLALQDVRRPAVQAVNLPPQDMSHLAKGGSGTEDDGRVVAVQEPQHRHRRAEPLAQPVPRLDRHSPVFRQSGQHLLLLGPQLHAQYLLSKLHGIERWRWVGCRGRVNYGPGYGPGIFDTGSSGRSPDGTSLPGRHRPYPPLAIWVPGLTPGGASPPPDTESGGVGAGNPGLNRKPHSRQRTTGLSLG